MIRIPRRGLGSIKTRGTGVGASSESSSAHSVYLKLAMLEIERERRAKEQVASAARAARLQQRMEQIDGEVRVLQKLMNGAPEGEPAPPASPAEPDQVIPRWLARRTGAFRF